MSEIFRYFEDHPSLFIVAGTIVSALCAVAGVCIAWYRMKKDRKELQDQVGQLKLDLGQLQERHNNLQQVQAETEDETRKARAELRLAQGHARDKETEFTNELESAKDRAVRMEANEKRTARLIKQMLQLEGRFWEKRIHAGAPRFRPLAERKAAIVSVLNLKGGVGKTTITAHLGAALANRGYRPLLVDIDLQGSLSSMFIPLDKLVERAEESRLLQHFLSQTAQQRGLNLLEFIAPVLDDRAGLVATTDDRKSTRLNSSHSQISYAVFCLKKRSRHRSPSDGSVHAQYPGSGSGVRRRPGGDANAPSRRRGAASAAAAHPAAQPGEVHGTLL